MRDITPLKHMPRYWRVLDNWQLLDNWQPPYYDVSFEATKCRIIAHLNMVLLHNGLKPGERVEVRDPGYIIETFDPAYAWHQDCHKKDKHMILWSNSEPTPLRRKGHNEECVILTPGDVILVNNGTVEHRYPGEISKHRIFARVGHVVLR